MRDLVKVSVKRLWPSMRTRGEGNDYLSQHHALAGPVGNSARCERRTSFQQTEQNWARRGKIIVADPHVPPPSGRESAPLGGMGLVLSATAPVRLSGTKQDPRNFHELGRWRASGIPHVATCLLGWDRIPCFGVLGAQPGGRAPWSDTDPNLGVMMKLVEAEAQRRVGSGGRYPVEREHTLTEKMTFLTLQVVSSGVQPCGFPGPHGKNGLRPHVKHSHSRQLVTYKNGPLRHFCHV